MAVDGKHATISRLTDLWSFSWDSLEVMLEGESPIDLPRIEIKSKADADLFLCNYGFDPESVDDARHMHAAIVEALHFMERHLMPAEWRAGKRPPDEIMFAHDVRDLLLWAAERDPAYALRGAWACAMLRILHTIAHIDQTKDIDIDSARRQIIGRFKNYIFRDQEGELRFGTRQHSVEVVSIDWKLFKSRHSILLKLLHKKGNVTEEINDLLGVRIITKRLCDVMLVAKLLRDSHMITYVNCIPARARNTLIDLDNFKHNVDKLIQMLQDGKIHPDEFSILIEHLVAPTPKAKRSKRSGNLNPHTGANYRSLQFTCRQMVNLADPHAALMERFTSLLASREIAPKTREKIEAAKKILARLMGEAKQTYRVFFPFEVHILDASSFDANKQGAANYDRYKRAQLRTARRRVLARLLHLYAINKK